MSVHFYSSRRGLSSFGDSSSVSKNNPRQFNYFKFRLLPAALLGAVMISGSLSVSVIAAETTDSASASSSSGAPPAELSKVIVSGTVQSQTAPSADLAAAVLSEIPGGTSLVTAEAFEKSRVSTAADVLALQPGVYAQAAGGQDAIRISIRGSGLNRGTGFFRSGALFLFDGLPVTGPGGTPFELFEPLGLNYVEVLRGANAFDYGALTLGGAINYVSNTGISAPGSQLRVEAGSFGYYKGQLSSGAVNGKFDYYTSLTYSNRHGYQVHSQSRSARLEANFGYRINPNLETRLYLRHGYTNFSNPGALTKAQLIADPTQANPASLVANSNRIQPGSTWLGSKTTYKIDADSKLELGVAFHNYPIIINGAERSNWWQDDLTGRLKYTRTDTVFAGQSNTTVALDSTTQLNGGVKDYAYTNYAGPPASYHGPAIGFYTLLKQANYNGSADNVLLASNDSEVVKNLWITTGVQLIDVVRESQITYTRFPSQGTGPRKYSQSRSYLAPRLGARYNVTPDVEVFANVSRSIEPESAWSFSGGSTATQNYNRNILPATATTVEFGTQGEVGISQWSLSYYHSDLKNEILTAVVSPPSVSPVVTAEENATPTTHQGIELALKTVLWQEGGRTTNPSASGSQQQVTLQQAYTWSDFHYQHDSIYGGKRLPGIPENFYQAELRYDHPSGFYLGANAEAASSYGIDYAESFFTNPYVIFGSTIGYAPPKKGWQVHLDFRNLADRHYVVSVSPVFNAAGKDSAVFFPGDGFGVFGGFSFRF
jgi:iron complex outermembrane receptor protein